MKKHYRRITIDRHFQGDWVEELSQEEILDRLFEDARYIWPEFSTSPLQMDPVIHMMFKAVSTRLKEVNDRINGISESIIRDMACRIFFDGLLHPVPSSTVLKFEVGAAPTDIDDLLEAYWVNTSQKHSTTFYFSPTGPKTLHPFEAVTAMARSAEGAQVLWTNPQWKGKDGLLASLDLPRTKGGIDDKDLLYIGIRPNGPDKEAAAAKLFISGSTELLGRLRWARWRFSQNGGIFGQDTIPGFEAIRSLETHRKKPEVSVWGYGYFASEHEEEYRDLFFDYPAGFAGPAPKELRDAFPGPAWDKVEPLYWIQIEFDKKLSRQALKSFEYAATNAVVAINTHLQKQSYYYHGPGAMTLDLQTPAGELHEITLVEDNRGRVYQNIYAFGKSGDPDCRYVPRIDRNQFRLVISPPPKGALPDRLMITYKTSSGAAANGIAPGMINALYTPHPGVEAAFNLTETRGGVNACTFDEMIAAFPRVLRSRNRAVVASDFESLALGFDSRIKTATARLGSAAKTGVVSRCVELTLDLGGYKFIPDEEEKLFLVRLERYLESRSPMGTIVTAKTA